MSELIVNPLSEPAGLSPESLGSAVNTGPVVIRLTTRPGPSDRRAELDEDADADEPDGDLDESDADSPPDLEPEAGRHWTRALAGTLAHGLAAVGRAALRGAVRYPRASLATGLSVVILGAVAITQTGRPLPEAQVPSNI